MAMITAAEEEPRIFSLPAVRLFGKKPHPGHQLSTAELHPGIGFANSNTTTGLPGCLYDSSGRSRSWNGYAYVLGDPTDNVDPLGLSCSIYLNNSLNLFSSNQLAAMQSALQGLLAPANADVTVGTTTINADNVFYLSVNHNPTAINSNLNPDSTVGYTIPVPGGISPNSYVFIDVLAKTGADYTPLQQNSSLLGVGAGRAGLHEFLHFVLQAGNSGHVPGTPFQSGFNAKQWFQTNPTLAVWRLSKSQVNAIQNTCGKKPPAGAGGGGGGGAGYSAGSSGWDIFGYVQLILGPQPSVSSTIKYR
jgi:hypothetical protein